MQGAWYILAGVAGVARPAGATPTTAVVPSHSTPREANNDGRGEARHST